VGRNGTSHVWDALTGQWVCPSIPFGNEALSDATVEFHPSGSRVLIAGRPFQGSIEYRLRRDDGDIEALAVLAEVLSGRTVDGTGGNVSGPLDSARWRELKIRLPEAATLAPPGPWHRDRAAEAEKRSDWFAAEFHFRKAIESSPDEELYARRGLFLARLGRDKESDADFARAGRRGREQRLHRAEVYAEQKKYKRAVADFRATRPTDLTNRDQEFEIGGYWEKEALLCLALGDTAAYRALCSEVREDIRKQAPKRSDLWYCLARIATLGPGAFADARELLALGNVHQPKEKLIKTWGARTYGWMLYRAGNFEESIAWLEQAAGKWRRLELDFLLAMAYSKRGDLCAASAALARTERLKRSRPVLWEERLRFELLRREAEAVLAEGMSRQRP
jgi:tetratricopeptide (TPR) repeat protein